MRNVCEQCEKILTLRGEMSSEIDTILESVEDPGKLADLIASNLKLKIDEAQQLLEMTDSIKRLTRINEILSRVGVVCFAKESDAHAYARKCVVNDGAVVES